MMDKLTLKIAAPMKTGGYMPDQEFRVDAVDGVPASLYWRNRLEDGDAVVVPTNEPEPPQPAPKAKKKD
jgi:hypothetical protein